MLLTQCFAYSFLLHFSAFGFFFVFFLSFLLVVFVYCFGSTFAGPIGSRALFNGQYLIKNTALFFQNFPLIVNWILKNELS